jgi:hypothetical protein
MRSPVSTRVPTEHERGGRSKPGGRSKRRGRSKKVALTAFGAGLVAVVSAGCMPTLGQHPFLVCTRAHESDTAGGYQAVNPSGKYRGADQFSQSTWNATAQHAGRPDLVGVDPAAANPADQDFLAMDLYRWQGASPWGGRCAGK